MAETLKKIAENNVLQGIIYRGRRCGNCKHYETGEAVYKTVVAKTGFVALEDFPVLRKLGLVQNPGRVDEILQKIKDGKGGQCKVYICDQPGDEPGMLIDHKFYCKLWSGIPGAAEAFPLDGDLLPEEIDQIVTEKRKV
jgi:hypothetical protein